MAGPAGHCIECHTPFVQGRPDYEKRLGAGGFEFHMPFGVVVSPNITPHAEDGIGRYTDELPDFDVDGYAELDARLGWRVTPGFSLAVIGRNLLNPRHQEFGAESQGSAPHLIGRELFLRAELRF